MKSHQHETKASTTEDEFLRMLAQATSQSFEKDLEFLEQELLRQPQNQRLYSFKHLFLVDFFIHER